MAVPQAVAYPAVPQCQACTPYYSVRQIAAQVFSWSFLKLILQRQVFRFPMLQPPHLESLLFKLLSPYIVKPFHNTESSTHGLTGRICRRQRALLQALKNEIWFYEMAALGST